MITKKEFEAFGLDQIGVIRHQGEKYFRRHINRLYWTYVECAKLLDADKEYEILSLGAGSAFAEIALVHFHNVKMDVAEFSEAIRLNKELYDRYAITPIEADLSKEMHLEKQYDIIMSCEIVEHLPISPSRHFGMFTQAIKKEGYLVVTTPNLRRIELIVDLLKGKEIMPKPEKFFAETSFENEGVHRREYLEKEIVEAMEKNGLKHFKTRFIWNEPLRHFRRLKRILYFPWEWMFPFFRRIMIIVGKVS